jgi:hypothetical protein
VVKWGKGLGGRSGAFFCPLATLDCKKELRCFSLMASLTSFLQITALMSHERVNIPTLRRDPFIYSTFLLYVMSVQHCVTRIHVRLG